jgi:hypothetical protein
MATANIIPRAVTAAGTMFQRLPNEVVLPLLGYLFMVQGPMDKNKYDIIKNDFLNVSLASLNFANMAIEAMYMYNDFVFTQPRVCNNKALWYTSLPPAVPAPIFRHYLRRIEVHIALEDYFFITKPGDYDADDEKHKLTRTPINSAKQLLKYSDGARFLHDLTKAADGFDRLESLDLHIYADFRYDGGAGLIAIREASFAVKAKKVTITIEQPDEEFGLFPELATLITVE